ncbi:hypothetical protein CBE91_01785 [Pasteurella multocida]|nr:hypothetical protein CBE91_01785 [Pasteurella multocida]
MFKFFRHVISLLCVDSVMLCRTCDFAFLCLKKIFLHSGKIEGALCLSIINKVRLVLKKFCYISPSQFKRGYGLM